VFIGGAWVRTARADGLNAAYYFKPMAFNFVCIDYALMTGVDNRSPGNHIDGFPKGHAWEFLIGNDKVNRIGLSGYYAVGLGYTRPYDREKADRVICLKIGIVFSI
jgi:hypothetical protein